MRASLNNDLSLVKEHKKTNSCKVNHILSPRHLFRLFIDCAITKDVISNLSFMFI